MYVSMHICMHALYFQAVPMISLRSLPSDLVSCTVRASEGLHSGVMLGDEDYIHSYI